MQRGQSELKNDIEYLYEMASDMRQDIADLKREVEWLRIPWPWRWLFSIWEFLRAPFGDWGRRKWGGDL